MYNKSFGEKTKWVDTATTTDPQEKCTKSLVPIVGKKQKFPSNQMEHDLFTVKIAIESENQVDISYN